jgi:hypothetical protein
MQETVIQLAQGELPRYFRGERICYCAYHRRADGQIHVDVITAGEEVLIPTSSVLLEAEIMARLMSTIREENIGIAIDEIVKFYRDDEFAVAAFL